MKFAVSNIALPAFDHASELSQLAEMGLDAVEVAPSRVWRDTWKGLSAADVAAYRRLVEGAGLAVVGLHSLFFDQRELGLFKDPKHRADSLDFLEHLSKVCRDLGGTTLIYGGGRNRGDLSAVDARAEAVTFFGELLSRTGGHGTCFCFEPLGPGDSDFINSALESQDIVDELDSPSLRVQLDAKALVENNEAELKTFHAVAGNLIHFHANEPGLGVLGSSAKVDHAALGEMLRSVGYKGYVSLEQRMLNAEDPVSDIAASVVILKECY
jgi:sugar phosphate isomerase/epimerase